MHAHFKSIIKAIMALSCVISPELQARSSGVSIDVFSITLARPHYGSGDPALNTEQEAYITFENTSNKIIQSLENVHIILENTPLSARVYKKTPDGYRYRHPIKPGEKGAFIFKKPADLSLPHCAHIRLRIRSQLTIRERDSEIYKSLPILLDSKIPTKVRIVDERFSNPCYHVP